jgi:hypothetical protein
VAEGGGVKLSFYFSDHYFFEIASDLIRQLQDTLSDTRYSRLERVARVGRGPKVCL